MSGPAAAAAAGALVIGSGSTTVMSPAGTSFKVEICEEGHSTTRVAVVSGPSPKKGSIISCDPRHALPAT